MTYQGYIQPIIVRRSGTHEQMVEAVARASVLAWINDPTNPAWVQWLASSFGKTVRRARPIEVEKCREWVVASVTVGDAEALACLPDLTTSMPAPIKKLPVTGTEAERNGWDSDESPGLPSATNGPLITINLGAGMSTGKTAAQAAHGVFGWARKQTPDNLAAWREVGMPLRFHEVTHDQFSALRASGTVTVLIEDAGHTEVDPNTATVIVQG